MAELLETVEYVDSQLADVDETVEYVDSQLAELLETVEYVDSQLALADETVEYVLFQLSEFPLNVYIADNADKFPVIKTFPSTFNFSVGLVIPIPTFPPLVTTNGVLSLVSSSTKITFPVPLCVILNASVVPNVSIIIALVVTIAVSI